MEICPNGLYNTNKRICVLILGIKRMYLFWWQSQGGMKSMGRKAEMSVIVHGVTEEDNEMVIDAFEQLFIDQGGVFPTVDGRVICFDNLHIEIKGFEE